mgnify:CR=1 FL=1
MKNHTTHSHLMMRSEYEGATKNLCQTGNHLL